MKTIKLFMDFEFTSLSPDAQPISLGIVSGKMLKPKIQEMFDKKQTPSLGFNEDEYLEFKSFYAEFSDFDMNRCDDWVKENVVSKLYLKDKFGESARHTNGNLWECTGITKGLMFHLKEWLEQFSDYQIQFVCDCGTYDWYWMVQLLDEREPVKGVLIIPEDAVPDGVTLKEIADEWRKANGNIVLKGTSTIKEVNSYQIGLPKLPSNISPVPEDLNDFIARVKGISVREAFDLNREELAYGPTQVFQNDNVKFGGEEVQKHNALWDAKVIKEIYQKLK